MNTDKIVLPDFLIADLYKGCLVDLGSSSNKQKTLPQEQLVTAVEVMTSLSEKIKFSGENAKNITIVINQSGKKFLNKEDSTFLTNILNACQLDTADIAIVNVAEQQVSFTTIKDQLNALQILLFDVDPSLISLPFKIPDFQVQEYAGCTILIAPALSALNKQNSEGKLLKTKLWNSLRQVFGII